MELRQLEYIREAAKSSSFTTAAQRCHVTASSLGQQIRNLERELGYDLFVREPGGLRLTDEGVEIANLARRVLDDIDKTKASLKGAGGVRLGIGYYGNALAPYLGHILARMHDRHPDVLVEAEEHEPGILTNLLLEGRIDCTLNYLDPTRADTAELSCVHVHDCGYLVVMREDLTDGLSSEVSLADISLPLMTLTKVQGDRLSYQTGATLGNMGFTVNAASNTHRSLMLQAECGQCAVLIPEDSWVPMDGLEARLVADLKAVFSTYLFWRKDNPNVAVKLFRQEIARYFGEHA